MSNEQATDTLNDLLQAECGTLSQHLGECSPFVSMLTAEDGALLKGIAVDSRVNQRALADLILKLRGSPRPGHIPTELGGVHYLTLSYLMPQIIAGFRTLIAKYESSSGTRSPEADALISRIAAQYRRQLSELQQRHAELRAVAPAH